METLARQIESIIAHDFAELNNTGQVKVHARGNQVSVVVLGSLHVRGSAHYYFPTETIERIRERLTYNLHDWKNGS